MSKKVLTIVIVSLTLCIVAGCFVLFVQSRKSSIDENKIKDFFTANKPLYNSIQEGFQRHPQIQHIEKRQQTLLFQDAKGESYSCADLQWIQSINQYFDVVPFPEPTLWFDADISAVIFSYYYAEKQADVRIMFSEQNLSNSSPMETLKDNWYFTIYYMT